MIKQPSMTWMSLILSVLLLSSCGKVTQITKKEDSKTAFSLQYSVNVTSQNTKTKSTPSHFTPKDSWVFTQVSGIKADGKKVSLSWGKAQLRTIPGTTSKDGKKTPSKLSSTAFRKDGVKLTKAKTKWAYISYSLKNKQWAISNANIKNHYDVYLISVYTKAGKHILKVFNKDEISKKNGLKLGQLTNYDTFITTLFLMDLSSSKVGLKDVFTISELSRLFTPEFFDALRYKKPKNLVKKFRVNSPAFIFDGKLEKGLLDVARLARTNDQEEVRALLKKLRKMRSFTIKASQLLSKNAAAFKEDN